VLESLLDPCSSMKTLLGPIPGSITFPCGNINTLSNTVKTISNFTENKQKVSFHIYIMSDLTLSVAYLKHKTTCQSVNGVDSSVKCVFSQQCQRHLWVRVRYLSHRYLRQSCHTNLCIYLTDVSHAKQTDYIRENMFFTVNISIPTILVIKLTITY